VAVLWSYPPAPLSPVAGTAVTAAALTAGTPVPPPIIPGGALIAGSRVRIEADLEMTSSSATPTLTIGFYIGAVGGAIGSATVIVVSAANALSASAAAWPITLRYKGTIRTLSPSAGVIQGTAELLYSTSLTAWATTPLPQTAAARTVSTLNTQQNNQLDVGITLSATTGSPSVTCTGFYAEVLG
jgi:hypothetical protein